VNDTNVQHSRGPAWHGRLNGVQGTILIVDNDLLTLELYQRELGREYRVLTCTDELEATEVLETEDVSAVVVEPVAVGEDGWARLAAITHLPSQRPVPVVVCSTQDDRKRDLALGAAACLVKPVLPATLLAALRKIARPRWSD
jgi:DNA-binding response OmpR family regulator